MPSPLVAPGELPPALVAGEGFLPGVRADVGGEVVAAAEVPHADTALEGFVAGVDAKVPAQLVRPGEPAVTALRGARVRPLVDGRLTRPVRVLPGSQDRSEREVLVAGKGSGHGTLGGRRGRTERKVPDGVERCERRRHPEGVQRVREGFPLRESRLDVSLAALLVEASVLRHNGEQRGAIYCRLGRRIVRWRRVVGHGAGGRCQVPPCRLVLVHVPAAGIGRGRVRVGMRMRGGVHVADVRLAVRHRTVSRVRCVASSSCVNIG